MQCKTRRVLALLLVLVCSMIVAPSVMASEDHAGWTIDIARQLLADGWEDDLATGTASVVGYAIHFVELERDLATHLGFGFDLDTGEQGPGLWSITEQDYRIRTLLDTQFHFAPNLHYELGHAVQSTSHDSWLITTSGRPLSVDISSTKIPAPSIEHKEERLEITIFPKNVDGELGQIESEITVFYETLQGTSVHMQTTAWVGSTSDSPIAVVSREVNVGRKTEYQYFAIYVAATLIPDELIPKDAPFIPMGTIAGMQEVLEDPAERRLMELDLGASYSGGSWGVMADGSLPIGEHLRVYGHIESLPDFAYVLGVEGGLNNEFYLVAELGDVSADGFVLRIGIRDELHLSENLKVSATLLPIRFTFAGTGEKFAFNWRIQAELLQDNYSLWYQAHNDIGQVRHNVGVSAFRNKPVGARFSWSWDGQHGSVFAAGIRLMF